MDISSGLNIDIEGGSSGTVGSPGTGGSPGASGGSGTSAGADDSLCAVNSSRTGNSPSTGTGANTSMVAGDGTGDIGSGAGVCMDDRDGGDGDCSNEMTMAKIVKAVAAEKVEKLTRADVV
jgi:hypothetical protein